LQAFGRSDPETLRSQNHRRFKIRLLVKGLQVVHGQLRCLSRIKLTGRVKKMPSLTFVPAHQLGQVDLLQIMTNARDLPHQTYEDRTFVF
jgi:hypothetical protein